MTPSRTSDPEPLASLPSAGVGRSGVRAITGERLGELEAARLATYRAYHAAAVSSASPLALDLLDHRGFEVDGVAALLKPDGLWLPWLCGPRPLLARRFSHRWKGGVPPVPDPLHDRIAFLYGGVALRRHWHVDGQLGIRLSPARLEVSAQLGPVRLRTLGATARFTTAVPLPETVKVALAGRPLDAVFDHPVLRGRGYVIRDVFDAARAAAGAPHWWTLVVSVPQVAWRVPWSGRGTVKMLEGEGVRRLGLSRRVSEGGLVSRYVCACPARRELPIGTYDAEA